MLGRLLILVTVFSFIRALPLDDSYSKQDNLEIFPKQGITGLGRGSLIKPQEELLRKFDRGQRIVGGEVVVPNAHPYQAGLLIQFLSQTGLCGGCLITNKHVLTAAHCLDGSLSVQTILGAHNILTVEPTQVRVTVGRDNYIVHEGYNAQLLYNDIAILVLPRIITFNEFIQPIQLPYNDMMYENFTGEIATVSGWGRYSDQSNAISPVLLYTRNEIKDNRECERIFGHFVIPSTICAITRDTRSGICFGDSGGPLTISRGKQHILTGIVSFVLLAGCQREYPTGFARITYFVPWISKNIENTSSDLVNL